MNSPLDLSERCSDCGITIGNVLKRKGRHLEVCLDSKTVNVEWGIARWVPSERGIGDTYLYDPPVRKRTGHNKGVTKKEKPKLANRLPREKGGIIAPLGDGLTPFERALMILGPRVRETKACYMLDGKPCNATDIMREAGIRP